jgi:hypothetical protein
MSIKIAPRATISDEFKTAMDKIYRAKLQMYQDQEKTLIKSPSHHTAFMQKNGPIIAQLRALVLSPARLDMEYTRLRGLPYTKFEFLVREGYPYLYGLTKDITLEYAAPVQVSRAVQRRRNRERYDNTKVIAEPEVTISLWDMGTYGVVVPLAFFGPMREKYPDHPDSNTRKWSAVQMIPMRDRLSHNRTPHHYATMPFVDGNPVSENPLDMEPNICWGGFSSIVYACGDECDVTELFRNIHIYLGRYNQNSPLVRGITDGDLTEKFSFARKVS